MCVCVYVCVHVHNVYGRVYLMFACMSVCVCVCMCMHMHQFVCVHAFVCVCVSVCVIHKSVHSFKGPAFI